MDCWTAGPELLEDGGETEPSRLFRMKTVSDGAEPSPFPILFIETNIVEKGGSEGLF